MSLIAPRLPLSQTSLTLLVLLCGSATASIVDTSEHTFLTDEDFLRPLNDADESFLTESDFENADLLLNDSVSSAHILAHQTYHKGDIRGKASWTLKTRREGARRNGVISGVKKWPNGRIPYVVSNQYNERERAVLARSFAEYQKRTCIRFTPRTAYDNDYLYIGKIDGCFSDVGKAGGRQELSLDDGCMQYDTAIHELMHSVGFYHEHERWDRDSHISVLWHNIDKDAYDQFGKVDLLESSYYGQEYDYHSIMHYDSLAFSKNGFETMVAKRPEMTSVIGSAIDFSPVDVLKINLMYGCREHLPAGGGGAIPQPPPAPAITPVAPPVATIPTIETQNDCRDRTTLCWRWLDRCRSFFFEKIMREFCAESCGFCGGTPVQPTSNLLPLRIAAAPKHSSGTANAEAEVAIPERPAPVAEDDPVEVEAVASFVDSRPIYQQFG